jgi:hypothetical protein
MPGFILNPIAIYGSEPGFQPPPPYTPTYNAIYFSGIDQYYYSGSNLFGDPDRRGGINRTFFDNSGSLESPNQWIITSNGVGTGETPILTRAGGSLRDTVLQYWDIESGSTSYKRLQTTNKLEFPFAQIEYADTFPDTGGTGRGIETSQDEEYALFYGQEFLRTSATDTHESGIAKLPYSTITSSYAGDSTFKTNIGSGPNNLTRGGSGGRINKLHITSAKKIGVCHNAVGWDNVTGSVQEFVVLNNDGSQDYNFSFSGSWTNAAGDEQNNGSTLATYYFDNPADGKKRWIVAGSFKKFNGTTYNHILAFDETGSIDTTFNSFGAGFNSTVKNIFKVDDDFMCVVGEFTTYNGSNAQRAVVLRYDGAMLGGMTSNDGNVIYDGVFYDEYLYLRGDFINWQPQGGSSIFANGIASVKTDFATVNPNYFTGTGSFETEFGYSDIFDTGSSQPVEVFLG